MHNMVKALVQFWWMRASKLFLWWERSPSKRLKFLFIWDVLWNRKEVEHNFCWQVGVQTAVWQGNGVQRIQGTFDTIFLRSHDSHVAWSCRWCLSPLGATPLSPTSRLLRTTRMSKTQLVSNGLPLVSNRLPIKFALFFTPTKMFLGPQLIMRGVTGISPPFN